MYHIMQKYAETVQIRRKITQSAMPWYAESYSAGYADAQIDMKQTEYVYGGVEHNPKPIIEIDNKTLKST